MLTLLASGWSPVYPCHVPAREMRQQPIGTGPFKFVEFKPNEYIKLAKNPDYWKPGRPYLDGIEYTIMREIAPRNLAFFAGNFDVELALRRYLPTLKDFESQAPQAICEMTGVNVPRTMLINTTSRPSTIRNCVGRWLWRSTARRFRHHQWRQARCRRGDDAAAERRLGHAGRDAENVARL